MYKYQRLQSRSLRLDIKAALCCLRGETQFTDCFFLLPSVFKIMGCL